jgi:cytochrome c oxidase subunit 2
MGQTAKRWVRRAGTLAALGALALLVSACTDFNLRTALPPEAASVQGEATRNLYLLVFAIGVAIFVLVEGLILFAVLRYRRREGDDELPPQIHGNNRLEIIWTAIPIAIVLALFFLSWQTLNTVDAHTPTPPIRIGVVAYQWQWQFVYAPDGVAWQDCNAPANQGKCVTVFGTLPAGGDRTGWSPPTMHVPVNETVELDMHSIDVIHSFYVPAFLYQRDITPGKDQVIQFNADRIGTYSGQCTSFCGLYHEFMQFQVKVETKADYDAWLQQQLAPSPSAAPAASAGAGAPAASAGASAGAGAPAASAGASAGAGAPAASAGASAGAGAPAASAGAGAPAASAGAGAAVTLQLTASGIAYDKADLAAPANTPFQIAFTNNDAGIPHNVSIHAGSATGTEVFKGEIFTGTGARTYDVPALPAGTYTFVCSVHPNMVGTLTVK